MIQWLKYMYKMKFLHEEVLGTGGWQPLGKFCPLLWSFSLLWHTSQLFLVPPELSVALTSSFLCDWLSSDLWQSEIIEAIIDNNKRATWVFWYKYQCLYSKTIGTYIAKSQIFVYLSFSFIKKTIQPKCSVNFLFPFKFCCRNCKEIFWLASFWKNKTELEILKWNNKDTHFFPSAIKIQLGMYKYTLQR